MHYKRCKCAFHRKLIPDLVQIIEEKSLEDVVKHSSKNGSYSRGCILRSSDSN